MERAGTTLTTSLLGDVQQHAAEHATPLFAHIDVTYRCDLRCVHCYIDEYKDQGLSTSEIVSILDQLADAGTLFVTFSGGEALNRPDIMEILAHARRRRFFIHLKTHGGPITPEMAAELGRLRINVTMVSVYSLDAEVHDAITTRPGSLANTLRGIELLLDQGLKVRVATPVMGENLDSYQALYHHFVGRGVDVDLSTWFYGSRLGYGEQSFTELTIDQVRAVHDFYQGKPVTQIVRHTQDAGGGKCMAGVKSLYIDPNGLIHPCTQWSQPIGDLKRHGFAEIWHDHRLRDWRTKYERDEFSACPATSLKEDGSVSVDPSRWTRRLRLLEDDAGDDPVRAHGGCGAK